VSLAALWALVAAVAISCGPQNSDPPEPVCGNADLELYEGIGMGHSFSTSQFSSRVFNGTIRYCP